jgi:hypothetical protein
VQVQAAALERVAQLARVVGRQDHQRRHLGLDGADRVLLAAAGTFALTMGGAPVDGPVPGPLNTATGLGLASISLAFAFGQLWWGLTQPLRRHRGRPHRRRARAGAGRVLVALGTALIPLHDTTAGLILAIGVLSAGGAGMAGPAVLMSATTAWCRPRRRGMATGIVNAGGSFGQFVFAPIAQGISTAAGWVGRGAAEPGRGDAAGAAGGLGAARQFAGAGRGATRWCRVHAPGLKRALADRSYRLLAAGFFVCGFHVAFLATHLPGVVASCQLPPEVGRLGAGVLGLFNIVGSLGHRLGDGLSRGWWRLKSLLSLLYATRALAVLLFVLAPKTTAVMLVFAA